MPAAVVKRQACHTRVSDVEGERGRTCSRIPMVMALLPAERRGHASFNVSHSMAEAPAPAGSLTTTRATRAKRSWSSTASGAARERIVRQQYTISSLRPAVRVVLFGGLEFVVEVLLVVFGVDFVFAAFRIDSCTSVSRPVSTPVRDPLLELRDTGIAVPGVSQWSTRWRGRLRSIGHDKLSSFECGCVR